MASLTGNDAPLWWSIDPETGEPDPAAIMAAMDEYPARIRATVPVPPPVVVRRRPFDSLRRLFGGAFSHR